jgi:hypothetical protein
MFIKVDVMSLSDLMLNGDPLKTLEDEYPQAFLALSHAFRVLGSHSDQSVQVH